MTVFQKGQRVRMNAVAKASEWARNSAGHIEEFGDSVGLIHRLMQWPNTPEPRPEYEVMWLTSAFCGKCRLYYLYPPEHLELVDEPASGRASK